MPSSSSQPKYHWTPSESAPKEYAMQIIRGHFELSDGSRKGIPTRVTLHNGWGTGRSTIVEGESIIALPVAMEITWFSYREDTYYRGKFELPYEKIAESFADHRERPYSGDVHKGGKFIVGVAPEGFVVVWMICNMQKRVVFTGHAEPVDDVPWKAVFDNPEFTKEQIMKETVEHSFKNVKDSPYLNDPQYWQRLHNELYRYDVVIDSEYTPYYIASSFLDKTSYGYYYEDQERFQQNKRSMPLAISFEYIFPDRIAVVPISKIDTDEMYAAFRHLSKDFNGVLKVVITMEGSLLGWGYRPRIRVENDKESIEIKNFEFRAIDSSNLLKRLKTNKHMQRYVNHPGKAATP